jgi:hypothetical protein
MQSFEPFLDSKSQLPSTGGLRAAISIWRNVMEEQEPQTRKASRRRARSEKSEYVIQFAPPPVKGQQSFTFDDELGEGNEGD